MFMIMYNIGIYISYYTDPKRSTVRRRWGRVRVGYCEKESRFRSIKNRFTGFRDPIKQPEALGGRKKNTDTQDIYTHTQHTRTTKLTIIIFIGIG